MHVGSEMLKSEPKCLEMYFLKWILNASGKITESTQSDWKNIQTLKEKDFLTKSFKVPVCFLSTTGAL